MSESKCPQNKKADSAFGKNISLGDEDLNCWEVSEKH
jgi:hypothetical protein